mgnify:CR=1 FL=1
MAKQFKPETLCVQAGWTPKKGEPRVLPIYQSTTFKYDTSEQMARLFDLEDSGYFYTQLLCHFQYLPGRRSFRLFIRHLWRNIQFIRCHHEETRHRRYIR